MSNVKLMKTKTSYEQLEQDYRGFIAPAFKLLVNNKDIVNAGMAVDSISVQMSVKKSADTATFSITNSYDLVKRDFKWTDSILKLGNPVEVYTGYTDQLEAIFFGYITNIEFNFSTGGAPTIDITAMDISFFMMRSGLPFIWKNMKISDIIMEIGRKYGITDFDLAPDTDVLEEVAKNIESDHEFIQWHANKRGYNFFVVGKKLYFREEAADKTSLMKLEWGKNLKSFRVEHDIAEQVSKVIVKGVLKGGNEYVMVESNKVTKIGTNSTTGLDIMKRLGEYIEVTQSSVKDISEAQDIAEARMDEIAMKLVSAKASCIGIPQIRAGRFIDIGGLGKKLDNTYYIESATHTIDGSGYQTSFNLQGNAV